MSSNATDRTFIETQFPVAKLSKESYAERKAVAGQTLTGLGKWWGRKPLVLCRATILGLLLPASDDPAADRDVFLRLMTMDDDGMLRRKSVSIPVKELFRRLPPTDRERWFQPGSTESSARYKKGASREEKEALQRAVFLSLSYDERLAYCDRPEQIAGPSAEAWTAINRHLGTHATSLPELVSEFGQRRFGHAPRVGDAFSGGGSIPFEAARLGCDAYGSDLNPVAALLAWAAINIVGGGEEVARAVEEAQGHAYDAVDRQVTAWGIEHREPDHSTGRRWRADAYLYCIEATCPECRWSVPLAPSWVVAEKTNVIVRLIPDPATRTFGFKVIEEVTDEQMDDASQGTVADSELVCPNQECGKTTPMRVLRGDGRGAFGDARSLLRGWESSDISPRPDDVFRERLYCVRWMDTWTEIDADGEPKQHAERHYCAPTDADLKREAKVTLLLQERFAAWQAHGFLPSRKIEEGAKTDEPIRTRGWTHWHHLYNPRQLLLTGLFAEPIPNLDRIPAIALLLLVGRMADWNSRLSVWLPSNGGGIGGGKNTFLNQAFNTLANYSVRPFVALESLRLPVRIAHCTHGTVEALDARVMSHECDFWITDPPYADAVVYAELSEFYLAWYAGHLRHQFPQWVPDARRALAVAGSDSQFVRAMVDSYRQLATHMPSDGHQVVMFTHQSAAVWADLALILWAAGLRVTAAWCIATETGPAVGEGNYVQGTVLMVLRKQDTKDTAFLDEVYQDVEGEVRRQIDTMRDLDDSRDPSFSDTDYQLAAYAAALRVLTAKRIEEIDVTYELTRSRTPGTKSVLEEVIDAAVRIACDHLVPAGVQTHVWKALGAEERFYLKGLEMESHGERRSGVYQELARGFAVQEYTNLLASTKANETRLRTASEFGRRELGAGAFGTSLVRHALFAVHKAVETETPRESLTWLQAEVPDYATNRARVIELLDYIAALGGNASMPHWQADAAAAALVAGALRNRQDNV